MGKRAKGEGTIWQDARGSWWAQLSAGPDGRRPRRKAGSEAEALDKLLELRAERAAGRDLSRKAETIAELLDYAIETVRPQIADGTVISYRTRARHVTDRIGSMKIRDVSTETVQRLANDLAAADLSPVYVKGILEQLSSAFQLVIPEKTSFNPVNWKKLKLRKATRRERQPADDQVVAALLDAADDWEARGGDARYAVAWWIAGLLGLRRGELAALTWADLNWEKAELTVRSAYATSLAGGFKLDRTKNRQERVLPVGPRLLSRLRQHWTAQQQERLRAGRGWNKAGFMLCNERGEAIKQITVYNRLLSRLCAAAKLPRTTPHQLRHTVATLISEEGYSEAVIAAILGHDKGGDVTRRYTHAREKAKRDAVLSVEGRILGPVASVAQEAR